MRKMHIYGKFGENGEIKLLATTTENEAKTMVDKFYRKGYYSVIMLFATY